VTNYLRSSEEESYLPCLNAVSAISGSDKVDNIDKLIENGVLVSIDSIMCDAESS
jgi:hypothetical protein